MKLASISLASLLAACVSTTGTTEKSEACQFGENQQGTGTRLWCSSAIDGQWQSMRSEFFERVVASCGNSFSLKEYSEGLEVISGHNGGKRVIIGVYTCN